MAEAVLLYAHCQTFTLRQEEDIAIPLSLTQALPLSVDVMHWRHWYGCAFVNNTQSLRTSHTPHTSTEDFLDYCRKSYT